MNWLSEAVISLYRMKFNKLNTVFKKFLLFLVIFSFFNLNIYAQDCDLPVKEPPEIKDDEQKSIPTQINIKNYPNFPKVDVSKISKEKLISLDSRLRVSLDTTINTKTSKVGDYVRAHVLEDFYIPADPPVLIIPRASWVRGRISYLKRPTFFSMSDMVNLKLYQLVTPYGEVSTLDTEVAVQMGFIGSDGLIEFLEQNQKSINPELGSQTISVSKIGSKLIQALISGALTALVAQNNNQNIYNSGQELQILLKKDLQFE